MPRVRLQDECGRTVQRYVKDYRITQDMAKKLCKLHHTAVGAAYHPQPFDWDALLGLLHKKAPRRSSYEAQLSDSDSLVTTTQIAKEYGCGAKVFNRLLHLHGIQYRAKRLDNNDSNSGYTYMYFGNEHYGEVTSHALSAGRDISAADCRTRARVCVIGETLRKYFFGAMSPIGQKLQIGGKGFEVIGVYAGKYDGKLNTDDQMIVMPYTLQSTMMSVYGMADRQYIVKAAEKDVIAELTDELLPGFMQGRCEAGNGYFSASSDSQWQEQSESSNNMLALLGGGVAGISLLVGGIGIMNIMLVSVTERTREIGIRMAIGARKRDIIGQFLVEASVVSCCGGVIGIVLGCFLSAVLGNLLLAKTQNSYMPTVEQFTVLPSAGLVIGAFLFSALLGIIFGLYPANKASNLQPVDALRTQ